MEVIEKLLFDLSDYLAGENTLEPTTVIKALDDSIETEELPYNEVAHLLFGSTSPPSLIQFLSNACSDSSRYSKDVEVKKTKQDVREARMLKR
jgi:hypothetical protein